MNFFQELITNFQNLVAQVPELVQPLILMLAGAIPSIEGDVAAVIGIVSGVNPIAAGIAGAVGNFLSVLVVVLITSGARTSIVNRRAKVGATVGGVGTAELAGDAASGDEWGASHSDKPESKGRKKGREKFKRYFDRFGVPGASLLGPLALPSQVTSAILVGTGSPRAWVLLWHAVSIVLWTAVASISAWAALTLVFLV
jgi:hypothetical protein